MPTQSHQQHPTMQAVLLALLGPALAAAHGAPTDLAREIASWSAAPVVQSAGDPTFPGIPGSLKSSVVIMQNALSGSGPEDPINATAVCSSYLSDASTGHSRTQLRCLYTLAWSDGNELTVPVTSMDNGERSSSITKPPDQPIQCTYDDDQTARKLLLAAGGGMPLFSGTQFMNSQLVNAFVEFDDGNGQVRYGRRRGRRPPPASPRPPPPQTAAFFTSAIDDALVAIAVWNGVRNTDGEPAWLVSFSQRDYIVDPAVTAADFQVPSSISCVPNAASSSKRAGVAAGVHSGIAGQLDILRRVLRLRSAE